MADKSAFVEHMEDVNIDENILFMYVLWKRETHFWPEGKFGKTHFDHVRSGLLLRLNEISTPPSRPPRASIPLRAPSCDVREPWER